MYHPDGALAATAVNKPFRNREWRTVRQTVAVEGLNAIDPPVLTTSLADRDNAATLSDRLLDLHGVPRRFFYVDTKVMSSLPALGSAGTLTHPRLGLGSRSRFQDHRRNDRPEREFDPALGRGISE